MSEQIKVPMMIIKQITCNECKSNVLPFYLDGFYECKRCKSITNNVTAVEAPAVGIVRIVSA